MTRFEETPLADVLHDNAALVGIDAILTGDGEWSARVQAATRRVESIQGESAHPATRAACADLLAALRAVEHSQASTPDAIAGEMHAAQAAMSDPATPSAERDRLLVRQHLLQRRQAGLAQPAARGIPRIVHLIRTDSSAQDLPLPQYLCYRSVLAHCAGYRVMLHTPSVPQGPRWRSLLPGMDVRVAATPQWLGNRRLVAAAHQSDVWRLRQVIEHGGFYLDWDLLLLRSPEALRAVPCVMALERKESDFLEVLGVSMIGAEPGSAYLRAWLAAMPEVYNPSRYVAHSVVLAHRLALQLQPLVRILDHRSFYYPGWTVEAMRWLFDPTERLPDAVLQEHMAASTGVHLYCSHANFLHWARDITEEDIAAARGNLAALMRPYL